MGISCPNKRLSAWKDLEKAVGEPMAFALWAQYDGYVPESFYSNEKTSTQFFAVKKSKKPSEFKTPDKFLKYKLGYKWNAKNIAELDDSQFKEVRDNLKKFNATWGTKHEVKRSENVGETTSFYVELKEYWDDVDIYTAIPKQIQGSTYNGSFGFTKKYKQIAESKKERAGRIESLDTLLTQKLSELGVPVDKYTKFKEKYGVDAIAMFEIVKGAANIKVDFSNSNELTLPEETAHFIIECMDDSVLVKRMLDLVEKNDYYIEVLDNKFDAYNKAYKGDKNDLIKEAAGKLLAQAIVSKFKGENLVLPEGSLSLMQRIWNYFIDLIKRIDRTELNKAYAEIYGNVAEDFLNGNLKFMEAIHWGNVRLFEMSDSALNRLKTKVEAARDASAKRLKIYTRKGITRTEKLEGASLEKLKKTIEDNDYVASALSIAESARHMYTHVTKRLNELEDSIKKLDLVGTDALLSLASILKGMKSFNDSYLPMLKNIETEIYSLSIDDKTNEDYKKILDIVVDVRRKSELVKDRYVDVARPIFVKYAMPFLAGGPLTEDNLTEALKNSGEDITFMNRFTDSMAMSGKPIMQVIDIIVKHAKQEARDDSYDAIKDLVAAHMEMEKSGVKNTVFMYEIGGDGKKTGNVVMKYNYGDFNKNKEAAGKDILDTIKRSNKNLQFSDNIEELYDQIQGNDVLLKQFKRLWGIWYSQNTEVIDNVDDFIEEKRASLGAEEFEDWAEDNFIKDKDTGEVIGYKGELSRPADKYLNKQYDAIQSNSAMKKYYDIAMALKESHDSKIPSSRRLGTLAPQVRTDAIQKIKKSGSLSEAWGNLKSHVKESLLNVEDDTELGDRFKITDENDRPVYFLPVHFTGKLKDINDLSTDFTESLAMFINKANDYNRMNKVIDILEIGRDLVSESEVLVYDSNGNPVKQSIDLIGKKILKTVKEDTSASNIKARTDTYFKMVVYGQARAEGKDFTFLGQKVNSEKLMDLFGRYTSLGNLALNIYAGIQNPLIGNANIRIEAAAKQHIDHKDLLFADARYASDLPRNLANIGSRNPNDFMTLFGEKMEVLQNFSRQVSELDMDQKTLAEKAMSINSLYITSSAGEHQMQFRLAYALAHAKKLKDSSGKEITLMDAFDIVGNKLVLKKGLKNLDGTDFNEVSLRAHKFKQNAINNSMHGIYNDIDLITMQQYGIARHALMFRKFIRPGYNRRWRKKMVDLERQTVIEGYYRTFGRFWKDVIYQNKKMQWEFTANWDKLEDWEKQNFWRAATDSMYITALNALIWFVLPLLGGDDEDEWAANMAAYQINRMLTEMTFYIDPRQTLTLIKSPMASLDQINRNINLIVTLANPWLAAEEIQQGRWKGYTRGEKALVTTIPLYKSILDWSTPENKLVYQRLND